MKQVAQNQFGTYMRIFRLTKIDFVGFGYNENLAATADWTDWTICPERMQKGAAEGFSHEGPRFRLPHVRERFSQSTLQCDRMINRMPLIIARPDRSPWSAYWSRRTDDAVTGGSSGLLGSFLSAHCRRSPIFQIRQFSLCFVQFVCHCVQAAVCICLLLLRSLRGVMHPIQTFFLLLEQSDVVECPAW